MPTNEDTALATLASAAGTEEKARACQQLAIIGSIKSVPALAALLGDSKLAAHARSGLEKIKDAAAGEALYGALPNLRGRLLAGAIISLGVRRETAAELALFKLSGSTEAEIRDAAIHSLGQIASPEAVEHILLLLTNGRPDHRIPAAHAALAAARRLDRAAASKLREAVRASDVPAHIRQAAAVSA